MKLSEKYLKALVILFATILVAGSSINCAHTVDYETIDSTKPPVIPPGPAFIRFLSVIDNGGYVYLYPTLTSSTPFATALPSMGAPYLPVRNDISFLLYGKYTIGATAFVDSITVHADKMSQFSLNTIVLFQTHPDSGLVALFVDDSMKRIFSKPGFCYIRFVNAVYDYPTPTPSVNVHIDDIASKPLFLDSLGNSAPILNQQLRNYIPFPIGMHTLYVAADAGQQDPPYYTAPPTNFQEGKYYTVKFTGLRTDSSAHVTVDEEN